MENAKDPITFLKIQRSQNNDYKNFSPEDRKKIEDLEKEAEKNDAESRVLEEKLQEMKRRNAGGK